MSAQRDHTGYEGSWHWDSAQRKLSFDVAATATISDLKGTWTPDGIGALLDGFSRNRLLLGLSGAEVAVNCALSLSDGRQVQLVGAFLDDSEAQGMILTGPAADEASGGHAIPGPELKPVFQPIVAVSDLRICGFEALARWDARPDDVHSAQRFENDGLASSMLMQSAEALAHWQAHSGRSDLFVHVNLTGRDLEMGGLSGLIQAIMDGFQLAPGTLRIELTEQAALRDAGAAIEAARAIKQVGAGLVMDDFGSGHSSFSWLADLPADGLKIDPALTRRIGEPRTDAILRAVTRLAHELGMTITGEGIEAQWQLDALREMGFDYAQGFAFARPMSIRAALEALRTSGGRLQAS